MENLLRMQANMSNIKAGNTSNNNENNFDNINETEILLIVQILTLNYVNSLEHVNKFYNDFFDYLKDKKDMPIIVLLSEYSFLRDFTGMILNYKNNSEIVINNFF